MTDDVREAAVLAVTEDRADVDPARVEVVHVERRGDTAVAAVTLSGTSGRLVRGMVGLERRADAGWVSAGGSWTSSHVATSPDAVWATSGGWSRGPVVHDEGEPLDEDVRPGGAYGGWVADPDARSVRVTDRGGRVEEATVDSGIAIILYGDDLHPHTATVELLDGQGAVLRSEPLMPGR